MKDMIGNIIINARASGFEAVGSTISEMGNIISGLSRQVINFGKDSANVYRDYEKSMADAEIALATTYGRNTRDLAVVMDGLDAQATEWAATSIFHTNDVANAITEAARAGWNYDQILSGIPAAMNLAQAGGLDLSQALDYVVKSSNAMGIGFDETSNFIDLWAYAANSSATNIDEVGEAMTRMGGTMKFADSEEELFTMLAVLADAGTVGEAAGTLLRNSMIRLIAPTKKAADVMAELGVESDEINEVLNDSAVEAANAELAMHGFSAYTEGGELKPMLQTFTDLRKALVEINGAEEGLFDNQEVLEIVSAIFPQRSIAGAIALLDAAGNSYDGLFDAMQRGEHVGYGQYAAEIEANTLWGAQEMLISKFERLQQVTGEELSGQLKAVYGWLGNIIDKVAGLPADQFSALVRAFEVLAIAGPALTIAGGALQLIANPVGLLAVSGVGLAMTVGYIQRLSELDFENEFGKLELDPTMITSYIGSIGDAYRKEYAEVQHFNAELEKSFQQYTSSTQTLKADLYSSLLSHTELTDDDKKNLYALADSITTELSNGIEMHYSSVMGVFNNAFGPDSGMENTQLWNSVSSLLISGYEESIGQAESLSQQLRSAMTEAFADGALTSTEIENISAIIKQMNELMSMQYDINNFTEQSTLLRKAQSLSYKDIDEFAKEVETSRDSIMESIYKDQDTAMGQLKYLMQYAADNGKYIDEEGNFYDEWAEGLELASSEAGQERIGAIIDAAQEALNDEATGFANDFNQYLVNELFPELMNGSDIEKQWNALSELAGIYEQTGGYLTSGDLEKYREVFSGENAGDVGEFLSREIEYLGGEEGMLEQIRYLEKIGDTGQANVYRRLLNMSTIYDTGSEGILGKYSLPDGAYDSSTFEGQWLGGFSSPASEQALLNLLAGTGFDVGDQLPLHGLLNAIQNGDIYSNYDLYGGLVTNARNAGYFEDERFDKNSATYERDVLAGMVQDVIGGPVVQQEAPEETTNVGEQVVDALANSGDMQGMRGLSDQYTSATNEAAREAYGTAFDLFDSFVTEAGNYFMPEMFAGAEQGSWRETVAPEVPALASYAYTQPETDAAPIENPEPVEPEVTLTVPTDQLESDITAVTEQPREIPTSAETSQAEAQIDALDDTPATIPVYADVASATASIMSMRQAASVPITVPVMVSGAGAGTSYMAPYAEGGRATVASIFGEGGPEWAIPEEHTDRTAELLNAARAASGFTWPELLARFGGLNANPNNTPTTLVYSPTIHAQNADGVARVLAADKDRLERWWEERKIHDAVEVYA